MTFVSGFFAIVPIQYANRQSQRRKAVTVDHFTSQLMHLCTTRELTNKDDVQVQIKYGNQTI